MDTFFSTLFTGKLAWVKIVLGAAAGLFIALAPLESILPAKSQAIIGTLVGIGTWLTVHGFHNADQPAKPLGS